MCTDLATSTEHCGECNSPCTGSCVKGGCETGIVTCSKGLTLCGDSCTDTNTDSKNRGECDNTCAGSCVSGGCR